MDRVGYFQFRAFEIRILGERNSGILCTSTLIVLFAQGVVYIHTSIVFIPHKIQMSFEKQVLTARTWGMQLSRMRTVYCLIFVFCFCSRLESTASGYRNEAAQGTSHMAFVVRFDSDILAVCKKSFSGAPACFLLSSSPPCSVVCALSPKMNRCVLRMPSSNRSICSYLPQGLSL